MAGTYLAEAIFCLKNNHILIHDYAEIHSLITEVFTDETFYIGFIPLVL